MVLPLLSFKSKKQLAKAVALPVPDWQSRTPAHSGPYDPPWQRAQESVAASSSDWTVQSRDWNYSSGGSGWDWRDSWASQQSPSRDQAAHDRSVRSRID